MVLKNINTNSTTFSTLDLLGSDEVALSKAFAFLLSQDRYCYFQFLRFIGVKTKNTVNNYFNSNITIEKKRKEGRTDIELADGIKYHVIIECKIKKGRAVKQRTQYLTAFNERVEKKVLCFLTQERDTHKQIPKDVTVLNIRWIDIIELYNNRAFTDKAIVSEFLKYTTKNYKMKELKEILIQGLGDDTEIKRFEKYGVYRRDLTFGAPIYFAPYFNRNSGKMVGISNLSKILGILSFKSSEIENIRPDLESFTSDKSQIENWIKGIKLKGKFDKKSKRDTIYTYYFLDDPLSFKNALVKDGGIKKGRGKNWIAANIPKNRCVTFAEFIKHIPELMANGNFISATK